MACTECDEIQNNECNCEEQYCTCDNISAVCVLYEGVKLSVINTYDGENLESILGKIDSLFEDVFNKFNGALYTNVGSGAQIFSKVNSNSQAEFRSIISSTSVDVVQNLEDIGISINETWLSSFITGTDIETTTTMTNLLTGRRIATYTNEDGIEYDIDETITTLVDNLDGTFTYTNENGVPTTFDVSSIETLTSITNTVSGNRIATYTDENSNTTDVNETITTLVDNLDNSLTYTGENGTVYSYNPLNSTISLRGVVELATNLETQTGTDSERAITPASLSSRTATETRTGILEIATQAEANALLLDDKIITPSKLPIASTTQLGLAEAATQTEVDAGTDTLRYVTPATLESKLSSTTLSSVISNEYVTTISSWSNYSNFSFSHGLGQVPKIIQVFLVPGTAVYGYQAGEEVSIQNVVNVRPDTGQWFGVRVSSTSTQINVRIGLSIVFPRDPDASRELINSNTDTGLVSIRIKAYA